MSLFAVASVLIVISALFTYIIIVFSIIGQGLTVGKLIKKLSKEKVCY